MNREQLIKKAKEIENKYYREVLNCQESSFFIGIDEHDLKTIEWTVAMDVMAELLGMTEDEYIKIFMAS